MTRRPLALRRMAEATQDAEMMTAYAEQPSPIQPDYYWTPYRFEPSHVPSPDAVAHQLFLNEVRDAVIGLGLFTLLLGVCAWVLLS